MYVWHPATKHKNIGILVETSQLSQPALAALVWVDLDRRATNCFAKWVDGDTSDGLRLGIFWLSLSVKVIKINCHNVCMCVWARTCVCVCVSRCPAFAIPQTLHLPPGTWECASFVSQPLEGRDKSWQSVRWRVCFPPKALRRGTRVNLKALTSADTSTCHVRKQPF